VQLYDGIDALGHYSLTKHELFYASNWFISVVRILVWLLARIRLVLKSMKAICVVSEIGGENLDC
jgi:hypothetical protein